MKTVYDRVDSNDLTLESVNNNLNNMQINKKYILIKGDIEETMPKFLKENPGFKASFIYIDVDIERPTYYALKYLWDRLLPGGIILFDEYEYHCFSDRIRWRFGESSKNYCYHNPGKPINNSLYSLAQFLVFLSGFA
jgi:hypothetical protein